jgi:hypothetical protein
MIGTVQYGAVRLVLESTERYATWWRIEAPVRDYFEARAKPGAIWILDVRRYDGKEPFAAFEQRMLDYYGRGWNIHRYEGPESEFPYFLRGAADANST